MKELTHHNPGERRERQWYQDDPNRLSDEIGLMQSTFPNFKQDYDSFGNIFWVGTVLFKSEAEVLYSLKVRIECPSNYPLVFPRVYDSKGVLEKKNCPHLYYEGENSDKRVLCFGNRLDVQLDFSGDTRIKNVVEYIGVFLSRQWYFEEYGYWPQGQPHGDDAFLDYELNDGNILPTDPCPCASNVKSYENCHMNTVYTLLGYRDHEAQRLEKVKVSLPRRNDPCPCGVANSEGKRLKYKKCCLAGLKFPNSRTYLKMAFPDYFRV